MQVNMSSELILKEVSAGLPGSYLTFELKKKETIFLDGGASIVTQKVRQVIAVSFATNRS
jgi:hypothetical protein